MAFNLLTKIVDALGNPFSNNNRLPVDNGQSQPLTDTQLRAKKAQVQITDVLDANRTISAGVSGFVLATNPTDVLALLCQNYNYTVKLTRVSITGIADTAATIDVLLQGSGNLSGGTATTCYYRNHDRGAVPGANVYASPTGLAQYYTANTTSGNGVSSSRPILRQGKLTFATATTEGSGITWVFGERGSKAPVISDLVSWLVVNLKGQSMPANAKLSVDIEWQEQRQARVSFVGDSTYAVSNGLFPALTAGGAIAAIAAIDNLGSNGFRLTDYINNTNSVTYPMQAVIPDRTQDILVMGYGINDVRTGATTQPQLISMIDAVIYATLNGIVSGATYTSPLGAGTTFTWGATKAASPDCKIILHGPNSLCTDDPTSMNYVTATGLFSGMTIAQAAQAATDILYNAYESFRNDSRIYALIQRQDVTGRQSKTVAVSGLHADQLHPNARGCTLLARQLYPTLISCAKGVIDTLAL